MRGGGPRRHLPADAQSLTQSEAPQLVEGGAADFTAGVHQSMAATTRPLEALELVEEEGGVGRVLEGQREEVIGQLKITKPG